ncbi:PREDICTED: protein ROOT PRIMORDIUM DEFECTIVE 1 [Nicotiana attenuata]|uniref:Protein root primordium defective 1 n=1 Tax=Nicotiana attenuata TaxID=49451 RepID=A0A314KSD7_NICAT|nr:PREDICTED: protein ROOT PRIMORDIUM DEFECTIVE 1 [Nicotiana attenuata]OIT32341.1 protein root primordium defective 1 [Nicotiana attenuata]
MHFLLRRTQHHQRQQWRTLFDDALSLKHVRDRGLDHAVEREKNLKPLLNIKNLIKSEPSKSIPLNIITQSKDSLQIPIRPVEFIRKYPSIFQEFFPASINIHPHIKLTPEILSLDSDEELFYQSVSYKEDVADRILKLLMIGKTNKIPLHVIDKLKWDLGLCDSYAKTLVPEYPDYFQVNNNELVLELVCWSHELAVSFMQKKAMKSENDQDLLVNKFALKYSNGFEVDKKYKKWIDEWQKLPYISPYENAMHLPAKSDEADKWAVAILHEILNLCVGKKAERDNLLLIGECLGLRSRFKRALMLHPGIFYVSSKIGTHTVVLKEGYKRGMLIQRSPLMEMRYKFVHLMNKVTEDKKQKDTQQKGSHDQNEGDEKEPHDDMEEEEEEEEDDEDDEDSDDVYNDYNDDEMDNEARDVKRNRRLNLRTRVDDQKLSANSPRTSRNRNKVVERTSRRSSWRADNNDDDTDNEARDVKPSRRLNLSTRVDDRKHSATSPRAFSGRNRNRDVERTSRRSSWRAENNSEQDAPTRYEDRKLPIRSLRTSSGRSSDRAEERTSRSSRRPEINDNRYAHQRSNNKLDLHRNRGRSEQRRAFTP